MKSYAASRLARVLAWLLRDDQPNELAARKSRWASRNIRTLFGQGKTQIVHGSRLLTEVARQSEAKRNSLGNGGQECGSQARSSRAFRFRFVRDRQSPSFVLESRNILLAIRSLSWTMRRYPRVAFAFAVFLRPCSRSSETTEGGKETNLRCRKKQRDFGSMKSYVDSIRLDSMEYGWQRAQRRQETSVCRRGGKRRR